MDRTSVSADRRPEHIYAAIDLKSFYASVECHERGLDPLKTNLVVADLTRTEKTICLAVSPSLKAEGIPGRPRLFEVIQAVGRINSARLAKAGIRDFSGSSCQADELKQNPCLKLDYITAPPRMQLYMKYSTDIYRTYLKFVAPEDIFPYSVDEVFIELTPYLRTLGTDARTLTERMIREVLKTTGITATAGIGTNMYLAKVAMDIVAKHIPPDSTGVRIASCDEMSYRRLLWNHRPLTDFWRVGPGIARKLQRCGICTMGDVARTSLENEELLYHLFGVNAELLIDHAWGYEPCTMEDVKNLRPAVKSMSEGQVLQEPYTFEKARTVIREMADRLALDLAEKNRKAAQVVLTVGYDVENLEDPARRKNYHGEVVTDRYGRLVPKHAHGTENLSLPTRSERRIREAAVKLYDRIVNPSLLIRRMYVVAGNVSEDADGGSGRYVTVSGENGAGSAEGAGNGYGTGAARTGAEKTAAARTGAARTAAARTGAAKTAAARTGAVYEQMDLFTDYQARDRAAEKEEAAEKAVVELQHRFGKNAVIKGMNLEKGATGIERNRQIGGHRA